MPKPNCTEEVDVGPIDFGGVGRRVVKGRFDGGSMTSDGGVMLLSETDRRLGLLDAAARCIADPRNPLLITHAVRDMLRQRVYGLALGWEDLNDHGALRCDVAMQTAVGVDHEVASAPTRIGSVLATGRSSRNCGKKKKVDIENVLTRRLTVCRALNYSRRSL